MSERLFTDHCDLPFIEKMDFDFVPDCTVVLAGLPTFDCPDIEIQLDTPPPPSVCPIVRVQTTVEIADTGTDPEASVVVTRDSSTSDSACRYLFDFDFKLPRPLPGPCPDLFASASVDLTFGDPRADVVITRIHPGNDDLGSSEQCAYQFDFGFQFPPVICASITATAATNITPGRPSVVLLLTQNPVASLCEYAFDFDFKLPPVICPDISLAATTILETGGTPGVVVTGTKVGTPSSCAFLFDFEFTLPPAICPTITGSAHTTTTTGKPSVDLVITQAGTGSDSSTAAGACEFIFDFDFHLPDAICPELSATATMNVGAGTPDVNLVLTKVGPASTCQFAFDFDFTLPPAICPVITGSAHTTVATGEPHVDFTATKTNPSLCEYLFDFDFHLPDAICPNISTTATMNVLSGTPAVTLTTTRTTGPASVCDFLFDFEFTLPPAICPTITADATATTAIGAVDAFVTVSPVGAPSLCQFQFDFDFFLPAAVCPQLSMSGSIRFHTDPNKSLPSLHILTTPLGGSTCQFQTDFEFTLPDKAPRLGKTSGKIDKGDTGSVKLYTGTPQGSETYNGTTVTVYNRFADVADDKWVHVVNVNNKLELGAAECG